jgi:DNA repair exonuclease SbcCD ATPase subunit
MSSPIYLQYSSIIKKQEDNAKNLHKKLSDYNSEAESGSNTIKIEGDIEKELSSLKEAHRELENAYSNKNAPSQISPNELDRRQKQIQNLGSNIQDIEQNYKQIKNKKYEYKGSKIDNYQPTEEMKTMSNSELLQYQQQKMKKQDDQIDDIIIDVKKGTVLAKETEKILDDQNKQLDELQEDIDKLDSKLKKGAKRFADYAAKKSGYCIVIILVLELIAGILFITLIK